MSNTEKADDCPTKKTWGEIWSGFFKKLVWRAADGFGEETGRSLGKILFWAVIGFIVLGVAGSLIGYFTDWFSNLFSWTNPFEWFGDAAENQPPPLTSPPAENVDVDCTSWRHAYAPSWLTPCK